MPDKNLSLPSELKENFRDHAWRRRGSMGGIVADLITEYAEGRLDVQYEAPTSFDATLKYSAPDSYDAAVARAKSEGLSLAEVIRLGIKQRLLTEEK